MNTKSLESQKFKRAIIEVQDRLEDFHEDVSWYPSDDLHDAVAAVQGHIVNGPNFWSYTWDSERATKRMWWRIVRIMRLWHSDEKLTRLLQIWVQSNIYESVEVFVSLAEKLDTFDDLPISWAIEMIKTDPHHFNEEVYDDTSWSLSLIVSHPRAIGRGILNESVFCV